MPIALRTGAEQPCAGAGTDPRKNEHEDPRKNEREDTPTRIEFSRVNKYLIRSHTSWLSWTEQELAQLTCESLSGLESDLPGV